jgi:uncharacterized protein YegP (UPF0339 family)
MMALGAGAASMLSLSTDINAQEKTKEAKKAEDKKGSGKVGSIEIKEGKDSKFRFSIYDGDEKFVAMSGPQGFATKEDAAKAVEKLKTVLKDAKVEYVKKDEKEEKKEKAKDKN